MKYHIERDCRMRFSVPAREHHLQIRLVPWHDDSQSLIRVALRVEPDTTPVAAFDCFGNLSHHFAVLGAHEELSFSMRAEVQTRRDNPFEFEPVEPAREMEWIAHRLRQTPRLWDFILHHGDLTPTLPAEIHGHSLPVFHEGTPLLRQVQDAMHWTRTIADYDASCDTSVTALPALFEARKGTAGDLAHLLIALVRKWQVPARFVSGYIDAAYFDVDGEPTGEHPPCPQSIHHWAEVLIPGGGWVGFDPALDLLADATYMRVAVGRDGKDIQALRQNCKGQAADIEFDETLSVSRISA